jgi:lipopolysaccharide export system protein LptA
VIFTGSPKVSSCGDTVSGEKIRFDMDSGGATVEGGEGVRVRALMQSDKKCTEDAIIEEDFCRRAR